jgi:hypothetical protein
MCERLKQTVLKTVIPERVSGVRIPLPPPDSSAGQRIVLCFQVNSPLLGAFYRFGEFDMGAELRALAKYPLFSLRGKSAVPFSQPTTGLNIDQPANIAPECQRSRAHVGMWLSIRERGSFRMAANPRGNSSQGRLFRSEEWRSEVILRAYIGVANVDFFRILVAFHRPTKL